MNNHELSIALAYVQSHPQEAARVLEQHDVQTVARFMAEIPAAYARPVAAFMLPHYTARIFRVLLAPTIAGILGKFDTSAIAAILRNLDKKQRAHVLDALPAKTQAACNLLLRYSKDDVGSWMSLKVPTIADDCTVDEALHLIRMEEGVDSSEGIFVVDRSRALKGVLTYPQLLRAAPTTPVATILVPLAQTLSGRISLQQAAEDSHWARCDVMAVLNRNDQYIGALRHVDLRRGLEQLADQMPSRPDQGPLTGIFSVYGHTLLALLETMSDAVEVNSQV